MQYRFHIIHYWLFIFIFLFQGVLFAKKDPALNKEIRILRHAAEIFANENKETIISYKESNKSRPLFIQVIRYYNDDVYFKKGFLIYGISFCESSPDLVTPTYLVENQYGCYIMIYLKNRREIKKEKMPENTFYHYEDRTFFDGPIFDVFIKKDLNYFLVLNMESGLYPYTSIIQVQQLFSNSYRFKSSNKIISKMKIEKPVLDPNFKISGIRK